MTGVPVLEGALFYGETRRRVEVRFDNALADRLAVALLNRRQIGSGDFVRQDSGAVLLTDDGRKTVLAAWQER
jgi:CRISPR associated protein Cas1